MAYGARLESGLGRKSLEGSNPSPSAILPNIILTHKNASHGAFLFNMSANRIAVNYFQ